ncbi:MAG: leucyl/phenylalanyl-tRNA--protein transferase [Rhodospirillales bacterium]|nr:leucyl/phenylalanyl-tRNA--protein transferase [Rhodospirillales bacterium]MCB9997206.1 leucyl/phenylalanyl-tRNA--protein transferase [Rhodospirillales bacterium]
MSMNDLPALDDVLLAYQNGLFPMAECRDSDKFYWYDPPMRGQLPIDALHIPDRLRRRVLQSPYRIRINTAFEAVIDGCAEAAPDRPQTWINPGIKALFCALHEAGYTHSVEAWDADTGTLVGGLYGMALGGVFMGESMFSRARDASKIALVHLCARLWAAGFTVLDTQYVNPHLEQFGVYEIPRETYLEKLHNALKINADFLRPGPDETALVRTYLEQR